MAKEKELGELILTRHHKKIYRSEGVITKVFDHEYYSGSDVVKEAMNQVYAKEMGFPVPELISVFPVGDDLAISSEEIKGKTLDAIMKEDVAHEKKHINELVKIQLSILGKNSSNLKLPKLKDKLNNYISNSGLDATTRYELHARLEQMPNHSRVCHGDITPHNIIIDDNGNYHILDWAHATRGNASADASCTYLYFVLEGNEKLANTYLKAFCKSADIAEQYVQKWIPVVSALSLIHI